MSCGRPERGVLKRMGRTVTDLRRPRDNRMIAGVCAAIARRFGMDPTLVRVLYVVASILSAAFPGIVVYLVLWVVIPAD